MAMKYHCEPCNKDFTSNHRLQRHLESTSAHQQAKHECHICHKFYMSKAGLAQHIKINHEKIKPKRRQCPLCEKSFCTTIDVADEVLENKSICLLLALLIFYYGSFESMSSC